MAVSSKDIESAIIADIGAMYADPLAFTRYAFPWGMENTPLADMAGPDTWQVDILATLGDEIAKGVGAQAAMQTAIQIAVASGHGIGKTAAVCFIVLWFMSTRPDCQIVVTANTQTQLSTKTWRELAKWHRLAINEHWFTWTATRFYAKAAPATWFASAIPWSENNPEAFAGTHESEVLLIFDEACHDDQTEVMTENGWQLFSELDGSERLLSMDQKTHECEYVKPIALTRHQYSGPMHTCVEGARNIDYAVTPNHRMWVNYHNGATGGTYKWRFRPMHEVASLQIQSMIYKTCNWAVEGRATYRIPGIRTERLNEQPVDVDMTLWCQFMGWFCSEGHLEYSAENGTPRGVVVSNAAPDAVNDCCQILEDLGIRYTVHRAGRGTLKQIKIASTQLAVHLFYLGDGCLNKRVPHEVRFASKNQIEGFLNRFIWGDGYLKKGGQRVLYTSSKQMADGLQELILKTGQTASVKPRTLKGRSNWIVDHYGTSTTTGWVITETTHTHSYIRPRNRSVVNYEGMVYCASLPKHELLLTRRNGHAMWSGNSKIPEIIWETASGALTTSGAIWVAFGNPTRNTGRFRELFGKLRHRWITRQIDSRTAKMANTAQLQQWVDDYGEDSDYVRVRVRGLFPRVGDVQLIGLDVVEDAMARELDVPVFAHFPKMLGVDVARFGDDMSVIYRRQGPMLWAPRSFNRIDTMQLAAHVFDEAREFGTSLVFVDGVGVGGGVVDRLRELGIDVVDVQSGAAANDHKRFKNRRMELWWRLKEWLDGEVSIPAGGNQLRDDLIAPEYGFDAQLRMVLESVESMKDRGLASPDYASALAMTFADFSGGHRRAKAKTVRTVRWA